MPSTALHQWSTQGQWHGWGDPADPGSGWPHPAVQVWSGPPMCTSIHSCVAQVPRDGGPSSLDVLPCSSPTLALAGIAQSEGRPALSLCSGTGPMTQGVYVPSADPGSCQWPWLARIPGSLQPQEPPFFVAPRQAQMPPSAGAKERQLLQAPRHMVPFLAPPSQHDGWSLPTGIPSVSQDGAVACQEALEALLPLSCVPSRSSLPLFLLKGLISASLLFYGISCALGMLCSRGKSPMAERALCPLPWRV